jgi:hypothetical protein
MLLCLRWVPNCWKALLLGMGLLLGAGMLPAVGQAVVMRADTAAPLAARPDTAAVVQRLFAAQRRGNQARLLATGAGVLLFNYFLAYSKRETTWERVSSGLMAALLGQAVYNLGEAVVRGRRYRPAREKVVLAALAHGQPLPRRIRKKLVAEYLKPQPTTP